MSQFVILVKPPFIQRGGSLCFKAGFIDQKKMSDSTDLQNLQPYDNIDDPF